MVFFTDAQGGIGSISSRSWIFLTLSGLATGASWLCFYKSLQMGASTKVVAVDKLSIVFAIVLAVIFLGEKLTLKSLMGNLLIANGTLLTVI